MLNKAVCLRCYLYSNTDWKKEYATKWFEERWNRPLDTGWVQCKSVSSDNKHWVYAKDEPPEWCPYVLEQVIANAK
jgi:hypothetical protein